MKYCDQVREVKRIVNERWVQGRYITVRDNKVCCCVHGAVQLVCNPLAIDLFEKLDPTATGHFISEMGLVMRITDAMEAVSDGGSGAGIYKTNEEAWKARLPFVYNASEQGNLNLHYLLGMFGISVMFNDDPETTLESLNEALDACADWTERHQEFLENN